MYMYMYVCMYRYRYRYMYRLKYRCNCVCNARTLAQHDQIELLQALAGLVCIALERRPFLIPRVRRS